MKKLLSTLVLALTVIVLTGTTAFASTAQGVEKEMPGLKKLSGKVSGALESNQDRAYYKYTATGKGYVKFTFSSEDASRDDWAVQVRDKDGYTVGSLTGEVGNPNGTFMVKKGTVLYLYVMQGFSTSAGDVAGREYTIKAKYTAKSLVETEDNNSLKAADKVSIGKIYLGAITAGGKDGNDIDYYKFKAEKSKKYKVSLTYTKELASHGYDGLDVGVYDVSNNQIVAKERVSAKTTLSFNATKGKTYYIKVDGSDMWEIYANTLYKLKVS